YYFWLADSRWYAEVVQNPDEPDDAWHDPTKLPGLLLWQSKPMVHLMWCRIHQGEIGQPQRSVEGVRLMDGVRPDQVQVEFEGRQRDSLLFQVVRDGSPGANAGKAPDGYAATPLPGFRYDLATDSATVVPEVLAEPPAVPSVGGLAAYPYFVYVAPGAPLLPLTPYAESVAVATTLRAHCRFEAALKWYAFAFDPLQNDVGWCPGERVVQRTSRNGDVNVNLPTSNGDAINVPERTLCCRHAGLPHDEAGDRIARNRSLVFDYLETLLQWGDCLMQRNAPEAFQQARLVFDTAEKILGPMPLLVENDGSAGPPQKVSAFVPDGAPINPRLMSLYERFADRLALIHHCANGKRQRNGRPNRDMPYFGNDRARDGWKMADCTCGCGEDPCCCPPSPYRFTYLVQKANELAQETQRLGTELQAAYEKGDGEYLAYVRAGHDHQISSLAFQVRESQWRDADWQVQALQITKSIAQSNRRYYATLLSLGLNSGEQDYQGLVNAQIGSITAATVTEAVATVMGIIPDVWVGTCSNVQLPVGTKLAKVFEGIARISMEVGQVLGTTGGLRLTQAGWARREDDWRHQVEIFDLEIEQIERQILGAERRRDVALRELESQTRQIENAREILNVLRDKFTNHELYLWLQKETSALHWRMYELARCAALQAERAFNLERGHTTRKFVPENIWDDLHAGLLSGERLELAVRGMEKAYSDENVREYELTKHVSLRMLAASAFLALKLTGQCVIELPEWLFDLDYPGHYMRRIKNVSLSLPCVAGPYSGVHAKLTLLSSATRIDPRLHGPVTPCCKDAPPKVVPAPICGCWPVAHPGTAAMARAQSESAIALKNGYTPLPDDPRIVEQYAAVEAIATSSGQNDAGLFELNFRDERYLPFEFAGAVSRWRLELPPENNYFDMDSLTDAVLHLNYTAREGGDGLRQAASETARAHLPDAGRHVFDLKREFPDAWRKFLANREKHGQRFELHLARDRFPFLPGHRDLWITRLELLVGACGATASTHREIEFVIHHEKGCAHEGEEHEFQAVGGAAWPHIFHGEVDVRVGPLPKMEPRHVGTLHFEDRVEATSDLFLIVHYEAAPACSAECRER
ncbi:MAG TPA: hypothetical protein VNO21_01765, partial [Polyangiaceae bacterium]|nr:hypothetical protein [Polyangiaceae bacterium]